MWLLRLLGIGKPVFFAVAVTSIAAAVAVEACPAPPTNTRPSASVVTLAPVSSVDIRLGALAPAAPVSPAAAALAAPLNPQPESLASAPIAARAVLIAVPRQVAPAKAAPKKVAPKKVAPKKVAPKKVAPKKVAPKKVAPKKAPPKKPVAVASHSVAVSALGQTMLDRINANRAQNGRAALRMNGNLVGSAHNHNLAMASANTMSHQLPGESPLQGRLAAVGYTWSAAGENVGWTTDQSAAGMLDLDRQMMAEIAPNDGHRVNLLNASYIDVGIDVYVDPATGKLWLTEDFGRPS